MAKSRRHPEPDSVNRLFKAAEPSADGKPPDDGGLPFEEWLKHRLRFGLKDDTIIVFIPSHTRDKTRLTDQDVWASQALELLGKLYGGATGFKSLVGIWKDDDGTLLDDEPFMIQSLAQRADIEDPEKLEQLAAFLKRMGKNTNQGAVGVVFNDAIHFVRKYE